MHDDFEFDPTAYADFLGLGEHLVKIVDHEFTVASTGTDQLAITFRAPNGGTHQEFFALSETAFWKLAKVFNAVGHTAKVRLKAPGALKKALYNKPLTIRIGEETYNGKARKRAQDFSPAKRAWPADAFDAVAETRSHHEAHDCPEPDGYPTDDGKQPPADYDSEIPF